MSQVMEAPRANNGRLSSLHTDYYVQALLVQKEYIFREEKLTVECKSEGIKNLNEMENVA
jgi:hypothetical protein